MALRTDCSPFLFLADSPSDLPFSVVAFQGHVSLVRPDRFEIELLCPRGTPADIDLRGRRSSLFLARGEVWHPFSGIITSLTCRGSFPDGIRFSAVLESSLALLGSNRRTRVFVEKSADTTVRTVLSENGLSGMFSVNIRTASPVRPCIVQYRETDLDFVLRIVREAGLRLLCLEDALSADRLEGPGCERYLLSDDPEDFPRAPCDIPWRDAVQSAEDTVGEDGFMTAMETEDRLVPGSVLVRDFCDETPETDISATARVEGVGGCEGRDYVHDRSCADVDAAQRVAAVQAGVYRAESRRARGRTGCSFLRAGMRFSVVDHPCAAFNGGWLATALALKGSVPGMGAGAYAFSASFEAIPAESAASYVPPAGGAAPRIEGLVYAHIEGGDEYARLDEQGRYRLRLAADIAESECGSASPPVRMLQAHAGEHSGLHFPLHAGTTVMVSFIDGDPARPVIVGALPDADHPSPVSSRNNRINLIRSPSGAEIALDDSKDAVQIRITSPGGFSLCIDEGAGQLRAMTPGGHGLVLDDTAETISLTSGKGAHLRIDDSSGVVSLRDAKGSSEICFDGSGAMTLTAKGDISLRAEGAVSIEGAELLLKAAKGAIGIEAVKDISLAGANISADATMELSLSGQTAAELSSPVKSALSGMTTEVSGSTLVKVEGKVVKIN